MKNRIKENGTSFSTKSKELSTNIEYLNSSNKEKSKTNFTIIIATILLFILYSCICLLLINYPFELGKYLLPEIFVSTSFWIICFGIIFALSFISFSIIEKQGANIKLNWYYLFFGIALTLEILFSTLVELIWTSLFLSAISLFLSLVILHEVKKTNKKAYAFFFPCLIICAYASLTFYVISMIN